MRRYLTIAVAAPAASYATGVVLGLMAGRRARRIIPGVAR